MKKKVIFIGVCLLIVCGMAVGIWMHGDPYVKCRRILRSDSDRELFGYVAEYMTEEAKALGVETFDRSGCSQYYITGDRIPPEIEEYVAAIRKKTDTDAIQVVYTTSLPIYREDGSLKPPDVAVLFYIGSKPHRIDADTGERLSKRVYLCYSELPREDALSVLRKEMRDVEVSDEGSGWYIVTDYSG